MNLTVDYTVGKCCMVLTISLRNVNMMDCVKSGQESRHSYTYNKEVRVLKTVKQPWSSLGHTVRHARQPRVQLSKAYAP